MKIAIRLFLLPVFLIFGSLSAVNNDETPHVKQGSVIYEFKTGKIQCQSEIDGKGQIAILYKSLKKNTTVDFVRVGTATNPKSKLKEDVIVLSIQVEDENPICAAWIDLQEITIPINPISVNEITLSGKTIFKNEKIHVMTSP